MRKAFVATAVVGMLVSQAGAGAAAKTVTVLDTYSVWRIHQTLKPPVVAFDGGAMPALTPLDWLNRDTPEPPAGWTKVDFDDGAWLRGSARAFARTPYQARLCLRGRFEVTDPSSVSPLTLQLSYYGGAIIHVNGAELTRAHVPKEGKGDLAEAYPLEAFVTEKGEIVPSGWVAARHKKATSARLRKAADVTIPAKLLRKGVNVVAVEIVRAPYHKILEQKKIPLVDKRTRMNQGIRLHFSWNTCEMHGLKLTGPPAGLVPNAARPNGLQVWNSDLLTDVANTDFGDRTRPMSPVALRGPRNGWVSGKVVLGSDKSVEALAVTCGDLTGPGGKIPAASARIRYGFDWGRQGFVRDTYARGAVLFDGLLERPLSAFKAGDSGAVVPLWVTLKIPAEAKAGKYAGTLTIKTRGAEPIAVPLSLEVADWKLPDARDQRTWVEMIQSPETLAAEYKVKPFSKEHVALIEKSMRYLGEIGSGVVYVPLICHTNFGNADSMVRWIKKDDGTCEYDFTHMDKYLDAAVKGMGKPKFVVFTAWEVYLRAPKEAVVVKETDSSYIRMEKSWAAARWDLRGKGPAVTALDPKTGKTETVRLPQFTDPKAMALWKPLFAQLRKRMAARGLEDTMTLGMASDTWPSKEELTVLKEASGGLGWVMHTHGGNRVQGSMYGIAPLRYIAYVWDTKYRRDPSEKPYYGWKQPALHTQFLRFRALTDWPGAALMHFEELNITGAQRGVGRIGADFWPTVKDRRGQRTGWVWDPYLQSLWHSLNLFSHMLVPGPEGPVATTRYELFREGIQQCEARIAIERALTDEKLKAKLGPDLARRCQDVLDQRLRDLWRAGSNLALTGRYYACCKDNRNTYGGMPGHFWFAGSGWHERTQRFYDLAGEVTRKLGEK